MGGVHQDVWVGAGHAVRRRHRGRGASLAKRWFLPRNSWPSQWGHAEPFPRARWVQWSRQGLEGTPNATALAAPLRLSRTVLTLGSQRACRFCRELSALRGNHDEGSISGEPVGCCATYHRAVDRRHYRVRDPHSRSPRLTLGDSRSVVCGGATVWARGPLGSAVPIFGHRLGTTAPQRRPETFSKCPRRLPDPASCGRRRDAATRARSTRNFRTP